MKLKRIWLFLLILMSLTCVAYCGTRRESVPDSKYLEYGSQHECVLRIAGICADEMNSFFRGSCVMIDEYHAVTAAHIVFGSLTQHIIYKGQTYPCAIVAVHKDFGKSKMGNNDIALIRLQKPIKLDFYPELYQNKDERDKTCSISGFGFTGTFYSGYKKSSFDNKRRAGSNIIDVVTKETLEVSAHKGITTELEFMISPGDSGGGLFIDKKLAGINSCVYATDGNADSDYGDSSCFVRISSYVDWISKVKKTFDLLEKQ